MSVKERSYYLAQLCTELVQDGNDFPTEWNTILKGHPLIDDGISHFNPEGTRSLFEMRSSPMNVSCSIATATNST